MGITLQLYKPRSRIKKFRSGNGEGEPLGFIVEKPGGILGAVTRQAFATHRPFRAVIMDLQGSPILWVRLGYLDF